MITRTSTQEAIEIIDILGGSAAVARRAGVRLPSVSNWKKKGIPKGRLIALALDIETKSNGRYTRLSLLQEEAPLIWADLAQQGNINA